MSDKRSKQSPARGYGFFATIPQLMPNTSYIRDEKLIAEYRRLSPTLRDDQARKHPKPRK